LNGIDEDGYCFSSRETMARALNISKSTLDDNLKKLLEEKLIRRTKVVSHNHTYYSYTVDIKRIIDIIEKKKQQELKGISAQRVLSVHAEG
jgi:predicted transcriptional regulator